MRSSKAYIIIDSFNIVDSVFSNAKKAYEYMQVHCEMDGVSYDKFLQAVRTSSFQTATKWECYERYIL